MRPLIPLAVCALAACSTQPAENATTNAVNATEMETPVGTEASDVTPASPAAPAPAPAPAEPAAPGTPGGLDNDTTPVSEAPFTEDSAQGAANVVQTYYALLGEGKYGQAYRLWEPGAAGMTRRAFAASFDKYSEYRARVGAPGRIDAGAGQRYVTVPVQVYGRLKQGSRPFNMRGSVTLHRAADIDGATAEQRSWRIRSSSIKPRPGEPAPSPAPSPSPTVDNRSQASYRCMDGSRLIARFDPDNRRVTIRSGGERHVLRQERVASGIRYAGGGYIFAGKGDTLSYTAPGKPPIACTVRR